MLDFWILTFSSFIMVILLLCQCWKVLKDRKSSRNKKMLQIIPLILLFPLVSWYFSFHLLPDIPNVLTHQVTSYQGNCKVEFFEGRHSGVSVIFNDNSITFKNSDFSGLNEGNYYCKVEYFPFSEKGTSLKLYDQKTKEEILSSLKQ